MPTAVQIEVRVDENSTNTSLSKIGTSIKQLQADVTTATKNLADAQLQLGKAAEQGNVQAKAAIAEYEAEVQRATEALRTHQTALAGVTQELSHQVPQYAAASGAVRLLEGNLNNMIRPAERFLATTLGLGPALQAAFPIVGAVAMIGVVDQLFGAFEHVKGLVTGMTQDMKDYEKEVIDGSHRAFLAVTNQVQAHQRLTEVNRQLVELQKQHDMLQSKLDNPTNESPIEAIANRWDLHDVNKQINGLEEDRIKLLTELTQIEQRDSDQEKKDAEQRQKDHDRDLKDMERLAEAQDKYIDKVEKAAMAEQKRNNSAIAEFDRLTNQMLNESDKQFHQESEQELHRHDEAVIRETKDTQKQALDAQKEYARQTQTLANDLYATFTDLTSGHIGKLITDGFKRLFANIVAQWLMSVDAIRNANLHGGGGGFFGALLSSFFGIGNGGALGASGIGTGPYGLPAGVAQSFGEFGGLTATDFGYSPIGSGGGGSLTTSVASATLGSIIAPTPVGGGTTGASKAGIGTLFSSASLSKLFPAAVLGTLLLGSKGGNSSIAAGGLLAAGGIGALMTNGPLLAAVAPYAGLLGPAAGGLIGFGLGQQYGPLAGALGGAASGAATAAGVSLALGVSLAPATLGISALIGGLVGLFAGLFGGGPSKHSQADKYINSNVLPLIQQELTNYEGFRTDFATSINDLEQLKTNSYNQMRQQFGKDATNDEWNKYIVPAIATAEGRINTDEAERQRRSTLLFGAPQFADGGIFPGGPMFGGAGMAVLHPMERVMTARATSMYGPELAAMEASAKAGARSAGAVHIGSILIQAGTVDEKWLRNGGALQIGKAIQRARIEGHAV